MHMRYPGLEKRITVCDIAGTLVEGLRRDLCMAPDRSLPPDACALMQRIEQRPTDASSTLAREHGHPADLAIPLQIDAARSDRASGSIQRQHMDALGITRIHLDLGGHLLLLDEHGESNGSDRIEIALEIRNVDSLEHDRSTQREKKSRNSPR